MRERQTRTAYKVLCGQTTDQRQNSPLLNEKGNARLDRLRKGECGRGSCDAPQMLSLLAYAHAGWCRNVVVVIWELVVLIGSSPCEAVGKWANS